METDADAVLLEQANVSSLSSHQLSSAPDDSGNTSIDQLDINQYGDGNCLTGIPPAASTATLEPTPIVPPQPEEGCGQIRAVQSNDLSSCFQASAPVTPQAVGETDNCDVRAANSDAVGSNDEAPATFSPVVNNALTAEAMHGASSIGDNGKRTSHAQDYGNLAIPLSDLFSATHPYVLSSAFGTITGLSRVLSTSASASSSSAADVSAQAAAAEAKATSLAIESLTTFVSSFSRSSANPPLPARYFCVATAHAEVQSIVRRALSTDPSWAELPRAAVSNGSGGSAGKASMAKSESINARNATTPADADSPIDDQDSEGLSIDDVCGSPAWSLLWTWGKPRLDRRCLLPWQRVNHFDHSSELTRKDLLAYNLKRQAAMAARSNQAACAFQLQPPTFCLPKDYMSFAAEYGRASASAAAVGTPPPIWITKPVGLSRGRGIELLSDLRQVKHTDKPIVVQRYLANPALLDGYKYDLRLYILVTSFSPRLEAYIYRRGFARLSTVPFTAEVGSLHDKFIHLTNSSIQKMAPVPSLPAASSGTDGDVGGSSATHSERRRRPSGAPQANASKSGTGIVTTCPALEGVGPSEAGGTKCSLEHLWKRLSAQGVEDTARVWSDVKRLVLTSLRAVADVIPAQPNAFELFGFDVLLDASMRPWLIEVNSSPSPLDVAVKTQLIADTVTLVNPAPFSHAALLTQLADAHQRSQPRPGNSRAHQPAALPKPCRLDANALAASVFNGRLPPQLLNAPPAGGVCREDGEATPSLGGFEPLC